MNEQNTREEDSDSRESSLSGDSNLEHNHHHHDHHPHQQHVRVLGEPLSDRSSSQSDQSGAGHRPRALIDAESRQEIDEYQAEDDSLQYFEEQERQIAMQMAQENIGGNGQKTAATAEEDGQNQHLAEEEETEIWREMMSRIEEEEDDENSAEDKKEVEDKEEKEEEMEEEEEGEKGRERSITEKEEEGEMEEEKEGEMEEEKEGKNNGRLSANSRISNGQEIPLRSSYSRISESLQNREFPGADLLSHPEEFDGQQKSNSAQPSIEGYPIGYPTEPPPAYSSPRKERPGTASSGTILRGSVRFPVPSPYEMTLTGAEHKVRDTEDHSGAEGTSATSNIRSAIVGSLTLAGGMATAVLATPSGDDPPKRSPFTSPRGIGHGVDSPRGDGQRQSAARVVQGARTVAELQQRHKTAQERHEKGGEKAETNGAQTQQQNKKEELDVDTLPHFPISAELKALFGQIEEYVAERVEIVPNWKPFQIDYIPAVGEVDPFIKVPKPDENDELLLGLAVLDEPATQQSDSAIVDLRLHQMAGNSAADAPVKKLSRADKNAHQIDRWIQNVKELRRTKAPTRVVYGKPMPSIESLMQEWPSEVEEKLKDMKLLINANLDADLEDFVDLCLGLVDIPVHKSRLEALHVLFSLYAEFRASQHFRNMALDDDGTEGAGRATSTNIDQFVVPD